MNKKSKIKSAWIGLENIEQLLNNFDPGLEYKYQFTSVDRLTELQQIFFLIKNHIHDCKINDEKKLLQLKEELGVFRGFLTEIQREWEDCSSEIDLLSKTICLEVEQLPELSVQIRSNEIEVIKEREDSAITLTEHEKKEFSQLLFEISKSRNVKIEDTRGQRGGGLFLSLLAKPGHVEAIKLKRLEALGLEIWPGKNFLT